jgi:hypothetical protein
MQEQVGFATAHAARVRSAFRHRLAVFFSYPAPEPLKRLSYKWSPNGGL